MSRYRIGVKDCDYVEVVTRGASGVEGGTYQDEDEVRGDGQYDVEDDVDRDSGLVKEGEANWGRGLELTSEAARQYQDANILKGGTSSKEKSQAPIELDSTNMVSTPNLLTDVSRDGSASRFLQYQEPIIKDDADEEGHLEQTVKDETIGDEHLEQDVKDFTVKNVYFKDEKVIDKHVEQSAKDETDEDKRIEQSVKDETDEDKHTEQAVKDETDEKEHLEQAAKDETDEKEHLEQAVKDETVRDELPPNRKVISAKALLQQHVDMDFQDWSVLLPEELVLILFKFLKPGDILATSQTCRLWRKLGENDKLWQQICKEAGLGFSLTAANLNRLERRSKKFRIAYSPWKENFLKPYKIAKKFRLEEPQVLTVEMSHDVNRMKIFNDKIVITYRNYRNDTKLYVFCALLGGLMHELVGHTSHVEVIEMDQHFIISGCHDFVKVWNVETGACIRTLLLATVRYCRVSCLQIHGPIVVSGSYNGILRVWDVFAGICLRTMRGHFHDEVTHLQFDGRLLVSGTESLIKVWDPQTGEFLRSLYQDENVNALKLLGGHLLVMHPGGSIKVWEVETGVCRHILEGINAEYMEMRGDLLVSRCGTNAKIWSLSTGACLHTLAGRQKHNLNIIAIGLNDKFVVTSSWDGKVILWDVNTGEFIRDLFEMESGGVVVKIKMKEARIVFVVRVHDLCGRKAHTKLLVLNFNTNEAD